MAAYTQEDRIIHLDTPLGKDVLLIRNFKGTEGTSTLFEFKLSLISEHHNIAFESIVGENITISIVLADGSERFFNGIVSRFSQGRGGGEEQGSDARFSYYTALMVPWAWLLTQTSDSRIFQEKSVPDIVEQIFTEKNFSDYNFRLGDIYHPRNYCVQYRETDFNFISRILEEEGIHYFFEHEDGKHNLILADNPYENRSCPGQEVARYQISGGGWQEEDVITGLEVIREIKPAKYTLNDYNFEMPNTNLKVDSLTQYKLGSGEREIYDYPGVYATRDEGDRLVTIRMQEHEARIVTIMGESDCRSFRSGCRFRLEDYYRLDMNQKEYLITDVEHEVRRASDYPGGSPDADQDEQTYSNRFQCIPFDIPYRPLRKTEKPIIQGAQTAIVTGPAGEEIYTDKHGRIKIQFHWDREGKRDENSSCWIRVSQVWAGAGWGGITIPRIGQEVIVDFLEGDMDRPIITGRVYHGLNTPPYGLPANDMISGLKSNSTPGGDGYNEMSMDDTKGNEKVTIHGQHDMNTTIEHDQTLTVHNNRTETIGGAHTETIKKDTKITISEGKYEHKVASNTAMYTVQGNISEIYNDNQNTTVAKDIVIISKESKVHITSATEIQLHVGGSKILMKSDGRIELSGKNIAIKGSEAVNIEGTSITSEATAQHQTKGSIVISEGTATNTVKGGMVLLNP